MTDDEWTVAAYPDHTPDPPLWLTVIAVALICPCMVALGVVALVGGLWPRRRGMNE